MKTDAAGHFEPSPPRVDRCVDAQILDSRGLVGLYSALTIGAFAITVLTAGNEQVRKLGVDSAVSTQSGS